MMDWGDIEVELDRWADAGRPVEFWLRSDPGGVAGEEESVARLRSLSGTAGIPLAVSICPQRLDSMRLAGLEAEPSITVLQRGFANANHEPDGEAMAEFGPHRELAAALSDLATGRAAMEEAFGRAFLPVLVPPFGFIDPLIAASLRRAGLTGLSLGLESRPLPVAGPGVVWANVHVSLSSVWALGGGADFVANTLELMVDQLVSRRLELVDDSEPIGIAIENLGTDECLEAVVAVLVKLGQHKAVKWLTPFEVFDPARLNLNEIEQWAFSQY